MPNPSSSLATLRPDLAASFEEFDLMADRAGFVGHRLMPVTDVARQSGTFGIIPVEELLRNAETRRAPRAPYGRGDWEFETSTYATEEHGFEEPVDEREAALYRDYFDAEQIAAQRAMDVVLRNAERRICTIFNSTSNFNNAAVGAGAWSTHATATPMTDVETAVQAFYAQSGLWPNTICMSRLAYRNVRRCAQILDLVKYQEKMDVRPGEVSSAQLAAVFDIPNVIVAGSSKNSANEGQAATFSEIWDKTKVWIGRVATSNDFREPCVGRTFHWSGDGSQVDGRVEMYRDETVRADMVRVRHEVQEKQLYLNGSSVNLMGRLITGVLS